MSQICNAQTEKNKINKSCVRSGKQVSWAGLRVARWVGKLSAAPSMYRGGFVGSAGRMTRQIGNRKVAENMVGGRQC